MEKRGAYDRVPDGSNSWASIERFFADLVTAIGQLIGCILGLALWLVGLVFAIWLVKTIWYAV